MELMTSTRETREADQKMRKEEEEEEKEMKKEGGYTFEHRVGGDSVFVIRGGE
jgi:hypothetical protein